MVFVSQWLSGLLLSGVWQYPDVVITTTLEYACTHTTVSFKVIAIDRLCSALYLLSIFVFRLSCQHKPQCTSLRILMRLSWRRWRQWETLQETLVVAGSCRTASPAFICRPTSTSSLAGWFYPLVPKRISYWNITLAMLRNISSSLVDNTAVFQVFSIMARYREISMYRKHIVS